MERHEILEIMSTLKLTGMRAAFDEVVADGLKRQYPVPRIHSATQLGDRAGIDWLTSATTGPVT